MNISLSVYVAGLLLKDYSYNVDVYYIPFAYGGLLCNGSEDNISQCSIHNDCATQPPALPGSACCNRGTYDYAVMSCFCKSS